MEQTHVGEQHRLLKTSGPVEDSGLLSAEELDQAAQAASAANSSGFSLVQALTQSKVLTPFQAEAFCNAKEAELRIGNYDVLDRLGAGGMGTVFKARHRRMKRIVALKLLSSQPGQGRIFRATLPARSGDDRPLHPSRTSSWPTMRTRPRWVISW